MGATLPADCFDAAAIRRLVAGRGRALAETVRDGDSSTGTREWRPPPIGVAPLASKLPSLGVEATPVERYALGRMLGAGGSGRVFSAHDHDFSRDVAVKFLHPGHARDEASLRSLVHEARVTARLEHPGILPIYDIDVAASGDVYFTMRKVDGMSLGDAIRAAVALTAPAHIATLNDRVNVITRVAEAVAFAHHRGVVHQDIKPDNIMLGGFGEVVLLDWGTATASGDARGEQRVIGTPLYMAPEQARRQRADPRSDVYGLGATLFHLFTLRPPMWDADADRFWERKRRGELDPPTGAERARIPARLLDIALKALSPAAERRYPDAMALVQDLKAWQQDLAISAHRDTLLERLVRLHRRYRAQLWTAAVALMLVLGATALWYREKLREQTTWTLADSDGFSGGADHLAGRWSACLVPEYLRIQEVSLADSPWSLQDGVLFGDAGRGHVSNIAYTTPQSGDLRIEWTLTAERDTNLNCFIGARNRLDGYTFHIGGWNTPESIALTKGRRLEMLDFRIRDEGPVPGRAYRMRMERIGERITLAIDGETLVDHRDIEALSGPEHQGFGFEVAYASVRIDDLSIWTRPLALRISALAVADGLFEEGVYARARARYEELVRVHPSADEVALARYRIGRCLALEGRRDEAIAAYAACEAAHPGRPSSEWAAARRAQLLLESGDELGAEAVHAALARAPAQREVREAALRGYGAWLRSTHRLDRQADDMGDPSLPGRIDDTIRRVRRLGAVLELPLQDDSVLGICAVRLNELGRHRQVVEQLADQRQPCAVALLALSEPEQVLARFPENSWACRDALVHLGRIDEVITRFAGNHGANDGLLLLRPQALVDSADRGLAAMARIRLGRFEEVLRDFPDQRIPCNMALLRLGRYEEAIARFSDFYALRSDGLIAAGRFAEVLADFPNTPKDRLARYLIALDAHARGAPTRGALLDEADARVALWTGDWYLTHFARHVMAPVLRHLDGGPPPHDAWRAQLAQQRDRFAQRGWYRLRYLLGEIDAAAFTAQPFQSLTAPPRADLGLLDALRADLAGQGATAHDGYLAYLQLSYEQRDWGGTHFARWRAEVLAR